MDNILFVNACMRPGSRTKALADHLLQKLTGNISEIKLDRDHSVPLYGDTLELRTKLIEQGDDSHPIFDNAKQFKEADIVVIAAPYWDLSIPAVLKAYIESLCVSGLTFEYSDNGIPISLCRAHMLYFLTTAGGYIDFDEYGWGYIKKIFETFFGVTKSVCIKAEGLDIIGADIEAILCRAKAEIDKIFEV